MPPCLSAPENDRSHDRDGTGAITRRLLTPLVSASQYRSHRIKGNVIAERTSRHIVSALSLVCLFLAACAVAPAEEGASSSQTTVIQPRSATASSSIHPSATPTFVAKADGYTLTVTADRLTLAPGGTVTLTATFHNGTALPIDVAGPLCGAGVTAFVTVDLPQGPNGRAWSGIRQTFKDYVLKKSYGPGGVPALDPLQMNISPPSCDGSTLSSDLGPGKSISVKFPWKAELVRGVDALPGSVPFTISAAYDLQNGPPSYPPGYSGIHGSWIPMFKQLSVKGQFELIGEGMALAGPGEIIDSVIADKKFASWLEQRPASTWSNANLFLYSTPAPQGILPKGAFWELDLFRENGVPRHWAIATINAFDASLIAIHYCNVPCDR